MYVAVLIAPCPGDVEKERVIPPILFLSTMWTPGRHPLCKPISTFPKVAPRYSGSCRHMDSIAPQGPREGKSYVDMWKPPCEWDPTKVGVLQPSSFLPTMWTPRR